MPDNKKILCFGEILLRVSPPVDTSWIERSSLPVYIGGAELNVARALANWQVPVAYCSAMPANALTETINKYLQEKGVDTGAMKFLGDRIGLYYMTQGADLKHSGVIYDRAGSSFSALKKGMIDWNTVFENVDWFHFSAITPAISQDLADVCEEALKVAVARNIRISVDLNYRAKLWKYGKEPGQVMPDLVKYCDVVMGNIWAAQVMLNIPLNEQLIAENTKSGYLRHADLTSSAIERLYPKCTTVANTFRFSGEAENEINYYGTLYNKEGLFHSGTHHSSAIVDKAGTGDCFMAGLIYSYLQQFSPQETIDYAAAAAFSKFFVTGDATNVTIGEIQKTIEQ